MQLGPGVRHGFDFSFGGALGDHHMTGNPPPLGGQSECPPVVARRVGHHAAGGFLVAQNGHGMARAAKFEGAGVLEVLTLQKEFTPGLLRQGGTSQYRRAACHTLKPLSRLGDHFGSRDHPSIHHSSPSWRGGPSSA